MANCWLIEIPFNEQQSEILYQLGLEPHDYISWHNLGGRVQALQSLIDQAGISTELQKDNLHILSLQTNFSDEQIAKFVNIRDYIYELMQTNLERAGISTIPYDDLPDILVINLIPFLIRAAVASRIISAIRRALENFSRLSGTQLIFLVRNHIEFSRSFELEELIKSIACPNRVLVIDRDGFCIDRRAIVEDAEIKIKIEKKTIPRSFYSDILRLDKNSLRAALVYRTNINIGHFDISTCHVRTHYDLTDFLYRDNVIEYLNDMFLKAVGNSAKITIITTGMELQALNTLANRIISLNNFKPIIQGTKSPQRLVKWIGHFSSENISDWYHDIKEYIRDSDCIAILTDIINTGSTLQKLLDEISIISNDTEGITIKPDRGRIIDAFAVAKMNNSPSHFKAAVEINRPYYKNSSTEKCPLCILGQPIINVSPETWVQDFRQVHPAQLTPLDFWEMVQDCNALKQKEVYIDGSKLTYKIESTTIIARYGNWLTNVLRNKCVKAWGDKPPDVIFVVDEPPSLNFTSLVDRSLRPHRFQIIAVPRKVIDKLQEPSNSLVRRIQECVRQELSAIIADDGINYGGTSRKLFKFLNNYQVMIIGTIVLDNRLSKDSLEKEEITSDNRQVIALYTWPSYPVKAT